MRRDTAVKLFSGPSYYIKRCWLSTSCSKKKKRQRDLREVFIAELGTRVWSAFGGKFAVALPHKRLPLLTGAGSEHRKTCWQEPKRRSSGSADLGIKTQARPQKARKGKQPASGRESLVSV